MVRYRAKESCERCADHCRSKTIKNETGKHTPGRGQSNVTRPLTRPTRQAAENSISKKEDAPVVGAPDIAHPGDEAKYERRCALVTEWWDEMLKLAASGNETEGHEARCELQTLFLNSVEQWLQLASDKKASDAKKWAHELLAIIFVSIGKHAGKVRIKKPYGFLMGTN